MENTTNINVGGTQQSAAVKYCTTCGEALNPMAEICPKCGVRQAMPAAPAPAVQPAPNVKYCTTCGESLNLAAEICPKCGVRQMTPVAVPGVQTNFQPQQPAVRYCTSCGASLNPAAEICPKCGERQTAASPNMFFGSGGGSSRSMGFFESWAACLRRTFDFKGRASQSEYAYFILRLDAILLLLCFFSTFGIILWYILAFITLIPYISVHVRRFHDFNVSGWFYLLVIVIDMIITTPIIAFFTSMAGISRWLGGGGSLSATAIGLVTTVVLTFIVNLVIALIKGTEGANRYGA